MRFSMMATYVAVILFAMTLLIIYLMGMFSQHLYDVERVDLFTKANIVSDTVISAGDDAQLLKDSINQVLTGSNMRSIVVKNDCRVTFDSNEDSDLVGKIIIREAINKCMSGSEQAYAITEGTGETNMMTVAVPLKRGERTLGAVYLVESMEKVDATIDTIRRNTIMFAVIICLLVALLTLWLSHMTTAPLESFTKIAKEISKGNFSIKAKEKGGRELVEMARAMNYMSSELNDNEENRKKFVSDVSHELKTPLATIKLICDSIVSTHNPDPEMIQEFLGDLAGEVDRLTRIVERLLTLTKMDSSQNNAKPEPVDFSVMLNAIVRKLIPNAQVKDIVLYTELTQEPLSPMMLDYDKIWEAVYNIVDNAIKYTPSGGFVRVCLEKNPASVQVAIQDNGPGIPDSEKDKIFDRFYRLDDSRTRDTGGTGLGLAIAKEAVLLHGGTITVENADQGGCVFIITLPYSESAPDEERSSL